MIWKDFDHLELHFKRFCIFSIQMIQSFRFFVYGKKLISRTDHHDIAWFEEISRKFISFFQICPGKNEKTKKMDHLELDLAIFWIFPHPSPPLEYPASDDPVFSFSHFFQNIYLKKNRWICRIEHDKTAWFEEISIIWSSISQDSAFFPYRWSSFFVFSFFRLFQSIYERNWTINRTDHHETA